VIALVFSKWNQRLPAQNDAQSMSFIPLVTLLKGYKVMLSPGTDAKETQRRSIDFGP
jgi:hypothetical protein